MSPVLDSVRSAPSRAISAARQPSVQTDLLQITKSVAAALIAWVLAVNVFDLTSAFLAPWTALLAVHITVHRSVSHGTQTVAATILGIVLSYLAVGLFGMGLVALGVTLFVGLLVARVSLLRDEGVTAATTALFVLTTSWTLQESMLMDRIFDVLIGVSVGVLVNLVVVPPLVDRSAEQQLDRIDRDLGDLLEDMAREMREQWSDDDSQGWIDRTRRLDDDLDDVWRVVRESRESGRWNPRRRLSRKAGDPAGYEEVLRRVEEGIAQARGMARMIHESTVSSEQWDDHFRERWLDLLEETGRRIGDPEGDVAPLRRDVDELTSEMSTKDLPHMLWPVYGSLLANLRNIITIVDDVASSRPVRD